MTLPACEMDLSIAIEHVGLLILGSIIFGTFIAAAIVHFLSTVASFRRREPPFTEINLQKPVRPGDNLSN